MTLSQTANPGRRTLAGLVWAVAVCGLGSTFTATAAQDSGGDANPRLSTPTESTLPPEEEETEDAVELPPFPLEANLRSVDAAGIGSRYQYLVDVSSLSLGPDRAVRYTIVVQAPSGAANVFYEGIRCWSREFRTFGYGARQGAQKIMKPVSRSVWKDLRLQGRGEAMGYRRVLADRYVCRPEGGANDLRSLRSRLEGKSGKRRPREE